MRIGALEHRLEIILLAALILRVCAVPLVHAGGSTSDEREYVRMGAKIAQTGEFIDSNGTRSVRAPLYPGVLALVIPLGGMILAYALNVGLGVVVVWQVYRVALMIWEDERSALAAGALAALYPGLVTYAALLQTETLYLVLMLASVLLAERIARSGTLLDAALCGAVSALAGLTRAIYAPFFPLVMGAVWVRSRPDRRLPVVAAGTCVWIMVMAPWAVRNYNVHQALVPVSTFSGTSLLMGNNPFSNGTTRLGPEYDAWVQEQSQVRGVARAGTLPEIERERLNRRIALDYIGDHPARAGVLVLRKLYVFFVYPIAHSDSNVPAQLIAMTGDITLWVALLPALLLLRGRAKRAVVPLAFMVFVTAAHAIMHAEARYRLPVMPLVAALGGAGIATVTTPGGAAALVAGQRQRLCLFGGYVALALVYGSTAYLFLSGHLG